MTCGPLTMAGRLMGPTPFQEDYAIYAWVDVSTRVSLLPVVIDLHSIDYGRVRRLRGHLRSQIQRTILIRQFTLPQAVSKPGSGLSILWRRILPYLAHSIYRRRHSTQEFYSRRVRNPLLIHHAAKDCLFPPKFSSFVYISVLTSLMLPPNSSSSHTQSGSLCCT